MEKKLYFDRPDVLSDLACDIPRTEFYELMELYMLKYLHFCLKNEELDIYFEDSLGRSGWLSSKDRLYDAIINKFGNEKDFSNKTPKEVLENQMRKSYQIFKRQRLLKIEMSNNRDLIYEVFASSPPKLILSLTIKELEQLAGVIKEESCLFFEKYDNKFELDYPENKLQMFSEMYPEKIELFDKLPEWINRFDSKEIKLIFDSMILEIFLKNVKSTRKISQKN